MIRSGRSKMGASSRAITLRITANLCGFALANLPAFAQLSGGPYAIQPLDVNAGGTTSSGGPYSISASTGQSGGVGTLVADPVPSPPLYQFDDGFWSTIGPFSPVEPTAPNGLRKNRYITFAPGNAATAVNFQATHVFSGRKKWVTAPTAGLEALNLIARLTGDGTLATMPAPRVWTEPVIHATDCMIVPVNSYEVRATTDGITFSAPLIVNTIAKPGAKFWADTNGPISGGAFTGPNELVDFVDINAAVQRFQNTAIAPPLTWVDIDPQTTNVLLNFADINRIVQGFQGQTYPFLAPTLCP